MESNIGCNAEHQTHRRDASKEWSPTSCMSPPPRRTRSTGQMKRGNEWGTKPTSNLKSRVPEIVEPKQLIQRRVLVKRARLTVKRSAAGLTGNLSHLRPSGIEYEAQPGIRHKTTKECENHVRELRTFFTLSQSHASNVHFFCETLSLLQDFQ